MFSWTCVCQLSVLLQLWMVVCWPEDDPNLELQSGPASHTESNDLERKLAENI